MQPRHKLKFPFLIAAVDTFFKIHAIFLFEKNCDCNSGFGPRRDMQSCSHVLLLLLLLLSPPPPQKSSCCCCIRIAGGPLLEGQCADAAAVELTHCVQADLYAKREGGRKADMWPFEGRKEYCAKRDSTDCAYTVRHSWSRTSRILRTRGGGSTTST